MEELTRRRFLLAGFAAAGLAGPSHGACPPTAENPQGPFYLPGAPFRTELASADEPGDRLRISGRVFAAGDCKPLAGAVLEVWQANATGHYYGLEAPRPPRAEDFALRGQVRTDGEGRYAFTSVVPGNYRISRTSVRAKHIHFMISHPAHAKLITQLYIDGDPNLSTDPLVVRSLVVPLKPAGKGAYEGIFDIALQPA